MEPVSELFNALVMYALSKGAKDIGKLPGCWEAEINPDVRVAMNGHDVEMLSSAGAPVPPFEALFWMRGMPAALVSPRSGIILGAEDTEDILIAALKAATVEH